MTTNVPISGLPSFVGPATGNEAIPIVSLGVTYQAALSQLLQAVPSGYVPTSRQVIAGTGLTGGGPLSADVTLSLANTAVSASSYGSSTQVASFTVDAQGRLTLAANVAIDVAAAGGVPNTRQVIAGTGMSGGGALSSDVTLNLANTAVTPGVYGDATTIPQITVDAQGRITLAAGVASAPSGYVPDTRQVIAGTGMSGGGALSSDVTLNLANTAVTPAAYGGAATVGTFTVDAQGRITLAADVAIAIANTAVSGLGTASTQNTGTSGATLPFLNGTNTWSGAQTFTTAASYGTVITLEGTSTDAGPIMAAYGNSATPAAFDDLFYIQVSGNSSTAVKRTVGEIYMQYVDPTNASEDARWGISTIIAGTKATRWWVGAGLYADGTADPGAGVVNATGYQVSGTDIFGRANTWTAQNTFSTASVGGVPVIVTSTDGGATGFSFDIYRNSATPAASDTLADIRIRGNDSGANATTYVRLRGFLDDPTDGSEDSSLQFYTMLAGVETLSATLGPGPNLTLTTAASFGAVLDLVGTDAGGGGPFARIWHNSASPAAFDVVGMSLQFNNTSAARTNFAIIYGEILDATAGSEDGQVKISTMVAGVDTLQMRLANGMCLGSPTSSFQGSGTLNATALYDDGVQILPITPLTMTAASGQSEIDFTGIPSTARRVTVTFSGLSLSGTDNMLIQLGDAGGPENTGYVSVSADIDASETTVSSTAGIIIKCDNAADAIHGQVIFTLMDAATFLWTCSGILSSSNGTSSITTSGSKALSAVLTQVRIDTTGTNTFDAGSVNVVYE